MKVCRLFFCRAPLVLCSVLRDRLHWPQEMIVMALQTPSQALEQSRDLILPLRSSTARPIPACSDLF
jgi:hypothetical protein